MANTSSNSARRDIKRTGKDVTIIAWSNMIPRALEAAAKLADEGIEVEVLDPRTLVPLDKEPSWRRSPRPSAW